MRDALLALPFGLAIGVLLGLVGGGGAILAVPVLVYVLGQDVKDATTASLLVVGATASVGAVTHARAGRVRTRLAVTLATGATAGAVAGTSLNRLADPDAILFLFGFVLIAAAYAMVSHGAVPPDRRGARATTPALAVVTGAAVGVLTGFFGVGGGFVIVPVLVLVFGLPIRDAVGTSLLVVGVGSTAALAAHLATGSIDWLVAGAFAAAGMVGAIAGTLVSLRTRPGRLTGAFAALLAGVGVALIVETVVSTT